MNTTKALIDQAENSAADSAELPVSDEDLRRYTGRFLEWHRKEYGLAHCPKLSDVRAWAKSEGLDLDTNLHLLREIHRNVTAILKDAVELELPPLGERNPRFSWTDFLLDIVKREKELKESELREEQPHRAEEERRDREERQREEVRSKMIFRPLSCDSTAVKDLEWQLTTGNIPSEEVQSVIAFLSQLCRKESGKCTE